MRKGTKRKAQNTAPESAEEKSTEPTQTNSASAGEIKKVESSDIPEKMDPDNAEPSKDAAAKEVETRKAAKQQKRAAKPKGEQEYLVVTPNSNSCITVANAEPNKEAADMEVKEVETAVKRQKRAAKPKEEPEYFKETRNLEDLWKQTFPVGTEWELLDSIYQYNWSFRNLEEAFEKGDEKRDGEESDKKKGILADKKVYLFGCTEPQFLSFQDKQQIVIIPVVVAVVSPFPPSDKLGITSVQREQEEIVPMKRMKMDWVPYIPNENRLSQVERLKSNIYILGCTQRRACLKHLTEDRVKKFTYCLPYIYNPFKEEKTKEDETEEDTEVPILYPDTEPPIVCQFDWKYDELEEFTDKFIEEDVLPSDKKEAFKEFVKDRVREAKKANREAKEVWKKALEEMSEETKTVHKNMKLYKFYPVPTADSPTFKTSGYINRYYGKADAIF